MAREVNRDTPQGGVFSPLIWNIVVEDLIEALQQRGFTAYSYVD